MSNFLLEGFFFFLHLHKHPQLWLFSSVPLAELGAHPIPNNHHFPRVGLPPAMPHSHSPNHSAPCSIWHGASRASLSILTHLWCGNNGHPIHFQASDPRDHRKERLLNWEKGIRSHRAMRLTKIQSETQRRSRLEHLGQGHKHPTSWVGNAVSLSAASAFLTWQCGYETTVEVWGAQKSGMCLGPVSRSCSIGEAQRQSARPWLPVSN